MSLYSQTILKAIAHVQREINQSFKLSEINQASNYEIIYFETQENNFSEFEITGFETV